MQKLRYSRYFKLLFILLDVVIITAVLVYFFLKKNNFSYTNDIWDQSSPIIIVLVFIWVLLSGHTKLYSVPRTLTYTLYLERLITHIIIFLFSLILIAKISDNVYLKEDRIIIAIGLFVGLLIIKSILFFSLKYIRTLGINHRNVMIIQDDPSSEILKFTLSYRKDYGFKLFNYPLEEMNNIEKVLEFWHKNGIHTLFLPVDFSDITKGTENELFKKAELNRVKITLIPSTIQNQFFQYDLSYIATQPVLSQTKFPLDYFTNFIIKRTFDIIFSLVVLVGICSWLFPIISILIKLDSKGPVFFLQKRYGYHDQIFKCFKFRTMRTNSESSSKTTVLNDDRITKIGHFLRKTSLDELPQFINVLIGNMSIVGPRPHMILVDDYFKTKIGRYTLRSRVYPGITGLAQVNGLRGDHGDVELKMKKRILADRFYVKNWSFVLDLVIVFKTIILMIRGDKNAI